MLGDPRKERIPFICPVTSPGIRSCSESHLHPDVGRRTCPGFHSRCPVLSRGRGGDGPAFRLLLVDMLKKKQKTNPELALLVPILVSLYLGVGVGS